MTVLILGLILFLGTHSVSIVAPAWRDAMHDRLGDAKWKGIYTLVSIVGFVLMIVGFGMTRQNPVVLYAPPTWGWILSKSDERMPIHRDMKSRVRPPS